MKKTIIYFEGAAKELNRILETPAKELMAEDLNRKSLDVTHDVSPENDVAINPVWCDIGGHQVSEWEIRSIGDTECCEDCFSYFTE